MMKIVPLIIILIVTSLNSATGQEFAIKSIEQTQEELYLYYDLLDTTSDRTYTITLFLLNGQGTNVLQNVSGDVGLEVRPGPNKKITWNAREELGADFAGSIQLEIRGRVYIPFIRFEGFPEGQKIKRGNAQTFAWTGQSRSNILVFSLYKGDEVMHVFPEVANTGDAQLQLPKNLPPGRYNLIINDSKNKDLVVHSPTFMIKRKVPFIAKLLPVIAVGAIVPFILPDDPPDDLLDPAPGVPGEDN